MKREDTLSMDIAIVNENEKPHIYVYVKEYTYVRTGPALEIVGSN